MTTQAVSTELKSEGNVFSIATAFAQSGMFPDVRQQSQAVVKILAGRELGFGPVYSMMKVYLIKGHLALAAEAMGALIKKSGRYDYQVITLTDTECVLTFTDNGKMAYQSRFTIEEAKRADLVKQDSGWVKWPRAMLMSKALSQGARIVCPHVIGGAYTPEDFGVEPNSEGDYTVSVEEPKPESQTNTATSQVKVDRLLGTETPKHYKAGKQELDEFMGWLSGEGIDNQKCLGILSNAAGSPIPNLKAWFAIGKTLDDAVWAIRDTLAQPEATQ